MNKLWMYIERLFILITVIMRLLEIPIIQKLILTNHKLLMVSQLIVPLAAVSTIEEREL